MIFTPYEIGYAAYIYIAVVLAASYLGLVAAFFFFEGFVADSCVVACTVWAVLFGPVNSLLAAGTTGSRRIPIESIDSIRAHPASHGRTGT